jgi:hypothetical protein
MVRPCADMIANSADQDLIEEEKEKDESISFSSSFFSSILYCPFGPVVALMLFAGSIRAQPNQPFVVPPQRDPLINMMMAQPKIDLSAPIRPTAVFDPPVLGKGQQGFYRVSFNALEESITMPTKLSGPKQIELKASAHGQVLQMAPPVMVPLTVFNFRVKAEEDGRLVIPEFQAQAYGTNVTIPAAELEVTATPAPSAAFPPPLAVELGATNLFIGQAAPVSVLLPGFPGSSGSSASVIQLSGNGFIVDQGVAHQMIQALPRNGVNTMVYTYETLLTPLSAGTISFFAQGFVTVNRFGGPVIVNPNGGGMLIPQYTLLESEDMELTVKPLPREGELPGFTGAIGRFNIEPPVLSANALKVGDPVKLTIVVRSNRIPSNFARLVPPPPPQPRDWQVFASGSDGAPATFVQARGFAEFYYTLIPLTEKAESTPPIPFSCFDPIEERYVDLTIPPVKVSVAPGQLPADVEALVKSAPIRPEPEKLPVLSGLAAAPGRSVASLVPAQQRAWFLGLQLVPAFGLAGLWQWDRRRRFLEAHPEVILRRKARRALRKQKRRLHRAARSGDARTFAATAVDAMRTAIAPHFPADPRALVGRDVLQVFEGGDGNDSLKGVVQRFFTLSDETEFSTAPADLAPLLNLRPQLDQVLERLEARL